jgi:integrase
MKRRRKTRSDKFPLTRHPTGQYCKKINGKIYYFGKNKKLALQKYLAQATYLHGGQASAQKVSNSRMTLKHLCALYLDYQHSKVRAGDLGATHYNDQIYSLDKFMAFIGKGKRIRSISTLDLQGYKRKLQSGRGSAHRLNIHIGAMKAMFHWARRNDVLQDVPNIDAVSRTRIVHHEMFTFSSDQIKKLLRAANSKMKAMILLGLNCGFGCTDCARLKWPDIDLDNGRVQLPRSKTGVSRNLPLWPETIEALKKLPISGQLVFYTTEGHPWVRTSLKIKEDGSERYATVNAVTSMFARLLKKTRIEVPKGTGFYALRRTAATLAARSGDPFAVQRLLGHVNLDMATRYVQDISEQTDKAIENSRRHVFMNEDVA